MKLSFKVNCILKDEELLADGSRLMDIIFTNEAIVF